MSSKPKILVAIRPSVFHEVFASDVASALEALGQVTLPTEERRWSSQDLAARIPGHDAVVTGWGTPTFDAGVLAAAKELRIVAHSAGSILAMLPPPVFERGIAVTHAASAIAPAVADMTLLLIMLLLRQPHVHDRLLKAGEPWHGPQSPAMGREIAGQRVGVVGAGYTGRCAIKLLRAVGAEVWAYDPYLSEERAGELGVRKVGLDELLSGCPIITLQAPSTKETHHMIGARELGLLQDGAIFVNTSRSWVVDQDAFLAELRKGRFQAAVDVFDEEPLPVDSPFRRLDNLFITPHIAGASVQARRRQGQTVVDELQRFFAGQPLQYPVTRDMLDRMA